MAKLFTNEILRRELTRKEFLKYTLGFMLMVLGISNFISSIRNYNSQGAPVTAAPEQGVKKGFGTSKFGV